MTLKSRGTRWCVRQSKMRRVQRWMAYPIPKPGEYPPFWREFVTWREAMDYATKDGKP